MRPAAKPSAATLAHGRWGDILPKFGISQKFLHNKHGPCPVCGGTKPFRFDDRHGNGDHICTHHGAGDGFSLLMMATGKPFSEVARMVEAMAENCRTLPLPQPLPPLSPCQLRNMWRGARRIVPGDIADTYLRRRGIALDTFPACLRTTDDALVAAIQGPDGRCVMLQRTCYETGERRFTRGTMPPGSAVRLARIDGDELAIAEGIETALSSRLPTWAVLTAVNMERFLVPQGVRRLTIIADNDATFTGQRAAYSLAHKVRLRDKIEVRVMVPGEIGDINDILRGKA